MFKTKRFCLSLTFILVLSACGLAQTNGERRVIEVTGSAETLITPNEFTFKISLQERIENKEKITIERQEAKLKEELAAIGVDVPNDLTIFDLTSTYVSRKRLRDVLGRKDYRLKLKDLNKIERLQEIADRLNVATLDLLESTHSEMIRLRQETKMEAIRAAKAKAEYMLGAIGERVGNAVYVREIPDEERRTLSQGVLSNINSNSVSSNFSSSQTADAGSTLTFSMIRLRYSVEARFEIQ